MAIWWLLLVFFVILLLFLKIFSKLNCGWNRSFTCLVGKTTIVTGANSGIGFYTAMEFAKRGGKVILACRNMERAEAARKEIVNRTGNPNVVVKMFDASSFASVKAFAKDFNDTEERLDILVNNAGGGSWNRHNTEDGYDYAMQVNYYSMFLLTHLLMPKLRSSAPSRIINVSSIMHKVSALNPDDLDAYPSGAFIKQHVNYGNSKLCIICFTIELARRLQGTGVTANSLHPGAVITEIWRIAKGWTKYLYQFFAPICFKTAHEGAQTTIYLSLSPEVAEISGRYFNNCEEEELSKKYTASTFLKKIWENTEKIVNLTPSQKLTYSNNNNN